MATTTDVRPAPVDVNRLATDRVARGSALVVRLTAAYLWLDNLGWKVPPDFGRNDDAGLYFFTRQAVDHPVVPLYSALVENVILPNFAIFAWLVFVTEICLATFLLLGLATRFWALVGVAQSIAIFLSLGAAPGEWKWSYFLMAATHLAILGFAAGRVFGIDAILRRRITGSSRPARAYRLAS